MSFASALDTYLEGPDSKDEHGPLGNYIRSKTAGAVGVKGMAQPEEYRKGGVVKRTGFALVHKGERILTKDQQKTQQKTQARKAVGRKR